MAQAHEEEKKTGERTCQVVQEDLRTLLPLLHGVLPYWEQFGCHLPVSFDRIQEIKKGVHHKDVKDKLNDVLHWYRRKQGPKLWKDVVKALQDIRNFDLASRVPQNGEVDVHDPAIYIDTMLVKYHLREVTSEWRSFGIQLGVPFQELKAIDQGRLTPMDCVEELLDAWIHRRGKDAKITDVIRACRSIGDHSLADNLEKHEVVKNIMSRSLADIRGQHSLAQATPNRSNEQKAESGQVLLTKEQETEDLAKSILRSHQTKLKDVMLSAGIVNIVYQCEQEDLITPGVKSRLVSNMTGQTEEARAFHLLDVIRSSLGFDPVLMMDKFLCILHKSGGLSGKYVASVIAEKFGHSLQNFSRLNSSSPLQAASPVNNSMTEESVHSLDAKKVLDKSPYIEDVLIVVPVECDCKEFRESLKLPLQGDLRSAIDFWIKEETTNVTWRNLIKGLKDSAKTSVARRIVNSYLKLPDVYERYIVLSDFESFEDLGI